MNWRNEDTVFLLVFIVLFGVIPLIAIAKAKRNNGRISVQGDANKNRKKYNLHKKQKYARFCCRVVFGAVTLAFILKLIGLVFGIEDNPFKDTSWWNAFGVSWSIFFMLCFFGMIKFLYDLDPGVQLRGRSEEELIEILSDENFSIWHSYARNKLEELKKSNKADFNL